MMQQTDDIIEMFRKKVSTLSVSPDTIILILQYAMECVEITTLRGEEKRISVVKLVRDLCVDVVIDEQQQKVLLDMIDNGIVSHVIDVVVAASRGKLHLNALTNTGKVACGAGAFSLCCPIDRS